MSKEKKENFFKKNMAIFIIAGLLIIFIVVYALVGDKFQAVEKTVDFTYCDTSANKSSEVCTFYEESKEDKAIATVFGQTTCSHCLNYKPIILKIEKKYDIDIRWYDIDTWSDAENEALNSMYDNFSVDGTPYTVITKNGKIVDTIDGEADESTVVDTLKSDDVIK